MPFAVRSLEDISRTVRGAFRQYLPGTDASIRQNVLYVVAKVQALLAREYELRLEWLFRQLFLRTADDEAIVRMHAADVGALQRQPAGSRGRVLGTGVPSETYPAGIRFVSGGTTYVTSAPFTANAFGVFEAIVAAEGKGFATNRDPGAILLLADPSLWPAIAAEVAVGPAGLGGGADREDMETLRQRALRLKASPPQGGALADYETWAREVPGVAQAWAANFQNGVGAVGTWLLFEGRQHGIPTPEDLAAVQAHIVGKRLVRGAFFAVAPTPAAVDLSIRLAPDSVMQRAAVLAALTVFFDAARSDARIRPGLPGAPFFLPVAWISEAISQTVGEDNHTLFAPDGDIVFQPGELPVLGEIDWS